MRGCGHEQWLRIDRGENGFAIQHHDRLGAIQSSLPHPATQYPSFVFYYGGKVKSQALKALYPGFSKCRQHGIANIFSDTGTMDDEHPTILTHAGPVAVRPDAGEKSTCHENQVYQLPWLDNTPPDYQVLSDHVQARLLMVFVDVLCIFAKDLGDLNETIEKLKTWSAFGSGSGLPLSTRPRLVVVTHIPGHMFESEALIFRLRVEADTQFSGSYSSMKIVNIAGLSRLKAKALYSGLGEVVREEQRVARISRENAHVSFSMTHITAFFGMAVRDFSASPASTFDFIQRSREGKKNRVSTSFHSHVNAFTKLCLASTIPELSILEFIASAILHDGFPPEMHCFAPSDIFRSLYRSSCIHGIESYCQLRKLSAELVCSDIEAKVVVLFSEMKSRALSAGFLRQQFLETHAREFCKISSSSDCFVCMQRQPEHFMSCRHGICDKCLANRSFSQPVGGRPYHYLISYCPQCRVEVNLTARVLPPTCRVRFLAFDGGGSRGIVSLGFMEKLRQVIGLSYAIQEHFDYAIGTSSGGLATIGLFGKSWSPKQCLAFFHEFARSIFPRRRRMGYSICSIVHRMISVYLQDGKYSANDMEEALKAALGPASILQTEPAAISGMKFAVTATTISDAALCLITNYNGAAQQEHDSSRDPTLKLWQSSQQIGHKHLRARDGSEILLWEAARCTTAAPSYFKPKYLPTFGTFQDGGLKYNNPVRPGLREIRRIWDKGDSDVVLSIGTGFEKKLSSPVATNVRNFFQDGTVARFYRAAMESLSLNGQTSWDDHWAGLEDNAKTQQFRLNLPLIGKEPNIDDVDQMHFLEEQIPGHLGDMEGIARALKAAAFFFELDTPLRMDGARYECTGSILSRSPDNRELIQNLLYTNKMAQFFQDDLPLGRLDPADICGRCGRFQKAIIFHVRHPSDRVNLQLVFNRLFRRSISGFPQSMEWFMDRQGMYSKFGRSDHQVQSMGGACPCEAKPPAVIKGQKRRIIAQHVKRKRQRYL